MPSIFCERTAEYALVSALRRSLQEYYEWVVPFYFWGNREGSASAKRANHQLRGRLLAVFARRVKTSEAPDTIGGKLNAELLEYYHVARASGIYSLAALPLVTTLEGLAREPEMLWLSLEQDGGREGLRDIRFDVRLPLSEDGLSVRSSQHVRTLSTQDIVEGVENNGLCFSYAEAMEAIVAVRSLKRARPIRYLYFLGGYKPVYFFLPPLKKAWRG